MADLSERVAEAVRRERGRIIGALLRVACNLGDAEEAFQDAALAAVEAWREALPDNPGAWLMTAAKNRALDARRRRLVADAKAPLLAEDEMALPPPIDEVIDDQLRLIFAACHPAISLDNRVALTLKVVAGFSTEEIARAFVCSADTISQRILRAKQALARSKAAYEIPGRGELGERVGAAIAVVYAMFNEGHTARRGPLLRLDLQAEALRLTRLLSDLSPREPEVFGALAIMAFGAARAPTRVDAEGLPVLLSAQDRSRWDRALIREGLMALARARSLRGGGSYVLEAEIAAVHVTAPRWEATDWAAIVALYEARERAAPSPIVTMNRAIAVAMRDGPRAGLAILEGIEGALSDHHHFFAARAELLDRSGADPRPDLERALRLVTNDAERALLERRLRACRNQ